MKVADVANRLAAYCRFTYEAKRCLMKRLLSEEEGLAANRSRCVGVCIMQMALLSLGNVTLGPPF